MTLFNNKYRVESTRLKDFNYSSIANYYVTINLQNKKHLFGIVLDNKVKLNAAGNIANFYWKNLPNDFENIKLGEYIIMPDHIHGIIRIVKQNKKTLSNVIQAFKSKTLIAINKSQQEKCKWQKRFYDRIIRDEKEYYFVEEYIKNNPIKKSPENYYKEWFEILEKRDKSKS